MAFQSHVYKVLIASPSDLVEDRKAAREAIHKWNELHSQHEGIMLAPMMWERHTIPEAGIRPQESVNKQIVRDCDILIGLFWTKLGTDTGVAESGTVEEVNEVVKSGKPVMLYFSKREVDPSKLDMAQLSKLREFQDRTYKESLVGTYRSLEELERTLLNDLTRRVRLMEQSRSDAKKVADDAQSVNGKSHLGRHRERASRLPVQVQEGHFRNLPSGSYMTIAITPEVALAKRLDVRKIRRDNQLSLPPIGANSFTDELFGDAVVWHDGVESRGTDKAIPPTAITELGEWGQVVSAVELHIESAKDDEKVILFEREERMLFRWLSMVLSRLKTIGLNGKVEIRIAVVGVRHARLRPLSPRSTMGSQPRPLAQDIYQFDPVSIGIDSDLRESTVGVFLKPLFDRLWRDAGLDSDPCFTSNDLYRVLR